MRKWLFIAEKPSLMREVQGCYNKHKREIMDAVGIIDFTALTGHVCRNWDTDDYEDWHGKKWHEVDYPMVPDSWGVKVISDQHKRKTVSDIKKKVKDYDGIVVGTDSDTEGYGIYYLLETYLKLQKKDALRFIESNLTDAGILQSLLSMTDYHKDPAHQYFVNSFILRSRTDWLFGMNATRVASLKLNDLYNVGRVKAPTLKLVYDNSVAIENFKPETSYLLEAEYQVGGATLRAILLDETMTGQKRAKTAMELQALPIPKKGVVRDVASKVTQSHAPKLFDLPTLQIESGMSPSETLETLQSLYEKHKVISYPRTQCRYVSTDKAKEFQGMLLRNFRAFPDLYAYVEQIRDFSSILKDKQVVNDKEVAKEAHDALLPTTTVPDLSKMTQKEQHICKIIYTRLLMQYLPKLKEEKITCLISHDDYHFTASGKTVLDQGFMVLARERKGVHLPSIKKGDSLTAEAFSPLERVTQPPKRLTQTTLLAAMMNIAKFIKDKALKESLSESKGIGTPATRDSIIKDLIEKGFVDDKKGLFITPKGRCYVESLKDLDIMHPVFAAKLDLMMKQVQRGEVSFENAYGQILEGLERTVKQINELKASPKSFSGKASGTEVPCPDCKGAARINKSGLFCDCGVKIFRKIAKKELTDSQLKQLLTKKKTGVIKGFQGAKGSFDVALARGEDGKISFIWD